VLVCTLENVFKPKGILLNMVNILIMGSNTEFQRLMRNLFNRWLPDANLIAAIGRESALAINAELLPQIVLLDISMASRKNLTFIQDIKVENSGASIFLLSNHGYPEYIEAAFDKGADGFFHVGSETFFDDVYRKVIAISEIDSQTKSSSSETS